MQIKNIHIIRGIAALVVVVYHAKFALWCGGTEYVTQVGLHSIMDYLLFGIDMLSSCGRQAVVIFFLLSAFVISHSFRKQESISLFVKIRIVRIYFPFLFSVLISALVLYISANYLVNENCVGREYTTRLFFSFKNQNLITLVKTLIFVPNNNEYIGFNFAYWSLFHEAIFYVLFPLYFRLENKFLIPIGIASYVLSFILNSDVLYYQTFFIAGLIMYDLIYLRKHIFKINRILAFLLMLAIFISVNLLVKFKLGYAADAMSFVLFLIAVQFLLLESETKIPKVLMNISDQSYSLYLFHLPILMLFFAVFSYFSENCVFFSRIPYYTGFIICVVINIPFYYLFEFQSLKIISKLKSYENN